MELTLDQFRKNLKWRGTISFDQWVLIVYGKVDRDRKMEIWMEINQIHTVNHFPNNEVKDDKTIISNDDSISFWASCNPYKDECDGRCAKEIISNVPHYWTSTNDSERCELPWVK